MDAKTRSSFVCCIVGRRLFFSSELATGGQKFNAAENFLGTLMVRVGRSEVLSLVR